MTTTGFIVRAQEDHHPCMVQRILHCWKYIVLALLPGNIVQLHQVVSQATSDVAPEFPSRAITGNASNIAPNQSMQLFMHL